MVSLCNYGCNGNKLGITWLPLIEIIKGAHYMCQMLCQFDELCIKERGGSD